MTVMNHVMKDMIIRNQSVITLLFMRSGRMHSVDNNKKGVIEKNIFDHKYAVFVLKLIM